MRPRHESIGKRPQDWLAQAHVRVVRYSENFPGTGSRQPLESGKDARFKGAIPQIIDKAAKCIEAWTPFGTYSAQAGASPTS